MKSMCDKAHSLGMKCGFYLNNCICREQKFKDPALIEKIYRSSVQAMVEWGYDGVKLDGCSQFHNISFWAQLLNETGRPFEIENAHDTIKFDAAAISNFGDVCPFNWYRISSDINPTFGDMVYNLLFTREYSATKPPLSRPGCWAYPDMLEVGKERWPVEDRTHFGAWCITSSPLILGYDLTNEKITDRVWHIITNEDAIAVNQAWAGSPGYFVRDYVHDPQAKARDIKKGDYQLQVSLWVKPMPCKGCQKVAAFILSNLPIDRSGNARRKYTHAFDLVEDLGLNQGEVVEVYDVWMQKSLGTHNDRQFSTDPFGGHDSRFYVFTTTAHVASQSYFAPVVGSIVTAWSVEYCSCCCGYLLFPVFGFSV